MPTLPLEARKFCKRSFLSFKSPVEFSVVQTLRIDCD